MHGTDINVEESWRSGYPDSVTKPSAPWLAQTSYVPSEVILAPGKRAVEEAFAAANGQQPTARRSAAAAALAAAFAKHFPTA